MKRALVVGGAIAALLGAWACGVITVPSEPSAPVNSCTDNSSCSARYTDASLPPLCFAGNCVEGTSFRPILVVGVPESPIYSTIPGIAGATFGLPDSYQSIRSKNEPFGCTNGSVECDFLPPLSQVLPSLDIRIAEDLGIALWPPGLRPNQAPPPPPQSPTPTSLPIHGMFHPMWLDPATGNAMLARRLGLPLDDRVMTITPAKRTTAGTPLVGPTSSPTATPEGTELGGTVPQPLSPTDPSAIYQLEIVPDSPFDVFPPFLTQGSADVNKTNVFENLDVSPGSVTRDSQSFELSGEIPVYYETAPFGQQQIVFDSSYEVDELVGAPSLAGWTMHIDVGEGKSPTGAEDDSVRVSGVATLPAGATKSITMWWATGTADQTNETLFIDPPPGVDLPRYFAPEFGGVIAGPFQYPALPTPVAVSGFVNPLSPTSARVVFFANGDPTASVLEADGTTSATNLLYEKDVRTSAAGQLLVTLPPGSLRAYVIPDDPTLAITMQGFSVTTDPIQNGKSLVANPRPHVTGRVILPDGTPVYGADVVIDASADYPFVSRDDPFMRPRESQGTTDADGRFDVLSDPGFVDVSIRPHAGTGFPWLVLTHRSVIVSVAGDGGASGGLELGDVSVPLPTPFVQSVAAGAITDASGFPLPHTTVRAYAFPPPGDADAGASPTRGARLIGSTVTDSLGVFQLFVTPPE